MRPDRRAFRDSIRPTPFSRSSSAAAALPDGSRTGACVARGRIDERTSSARHVMVPLSVLDLSPVAAGSSGAVALRNSLDLARLADQLGFTRYWVAEHHNLP